MLRIDELGVDDDFFEVGGDSLLSIRVIARAGREGIRLSPERFFERPTVRHMAAGIEEAQRAATGVPLSPAASVDPTGDAPLTPIQHWFLEAVPAHRDWWNQGFALAVDASLPERTLREALAALLDHHDALRLQLVREGDAWRQSFAVRGGALPLRVVSVGAASSAERLAQVRVEGEREHAALRLGEGPLFRFVLLEGDGTWRRLLLIGHHLVLDGVSWGVILEDLATLATQARAGAPFRLPPPTASARAWALALADAARTPAVAAAVAHWAVHDRARPLPPDTTAPGTAPPHVAPAPGARTTYNRDARTVTVTLDAGRTHRLVHDAARQLDAPVQALLLAALLLAWRDWDGGDALPLDLEGHGRDILGESLDVSRTVGWFTTVFPVRLTLPQGAGDEAEPRLDAVVRAVRQALDALPLRGAAHGLLRYLSPDAAIRERLAAQPRPAVLFNYLGAFDLALPEASGLRLTDEPTGRTRDPEAVRPYLLEINARQQAGRLSVVIEYDHTVHDAATMARLAGALRTALERLADGPVHAFGAAELETIAALLAAADEEEDGEAVQRDHDPTPRPFAGDA